MEESEEKFFHETADEDLRAAENNNVQVEFTKVGGAMSRPRVSARNEARTFEGEPEGQLTIDVYQTPEEIIVESAVAGVEPHDLDINVTTDSVTIRGERQRNKEVKNEDYFYQECYWGRFSRSVILPQEVDPEGASANFKNGILTVHLPKLKRERAKKVRVRLE